MGPIPVGQSGLFGLASKKIRDCSNQSVVQFLTDISFVEMDCLLLKTFIQQASFFVCTVLDIAKMTTLRA